MVGAVHRLRARLGGPFDRPAPAWLVRLMGNEPPPALELDRVDVVSRAHLEELRDGLGRGLHFWQYPNQLAPYLSLFSEIPVRRYLELGVQHGGTFVLSTEYFDRFHAMEKAIAVDISRVRSGPAYRRMQPRASFVTVDSGEPRFARMLEREGPFDLVLIDGDHSREAVRRDWETVRPHASVIAFHDIVDSMSPGVAEVWADVRREHADAYEFHEFTQQYPEVQ